MRIADHTPAAAAAALVLLLVGCSPRAVSPPASVSGGAFTGAEAEVRALNDRLSAAVLAGDAAAMGVILAPDYVFISATGGMGDRASMLGGYAAGTIRYTTYRADSVRVRLFGDAAVVTGVTVREGSSAAGGDLSGRFRSTRVYARRGGAWQLASAHESRINTPDVAK